jgi:hypothetical protein
MADRAVKPRSSGRVDPPRIWTAREANARVADLTELLPRLKGWVTRLGEVHEEQERLRSFWGRDVVASDHPDHEHKVRLDAEWQNLTQRLEEALGSLRREGIEVKNLDEGLVDFYGLVENEVVFLCWQRGESDVAFFHPVTGGYRDRKPIPEPVRAAAPASSHDRH